ncbi:hypothetical protein PHLCEN_2v6325, partial [Hermanssonia centrifuga]
MPPKVTTRASNANAHPGEVVRQGRRTRRSAAEMQAVREAEVLEKAEKDNTERNKQALLRAIAKLKVEEANKRRDQAKNPPTPQGLAVKAKPSKQTGFSNSEIDTGSAKIPKTPLKRSTTAEDDGKGSVKKARTRTSAAKLTRTNIELIRESLESEESPTRKGRGGKGKELILGAKNPAPVKSQQGTSRTKAANSGKGPSEAIGGFLKGYHPLAVAKAGKKVKQYKKDEDPIEDVEMEDYDEEGDEERLSDGDVPSDQEEEEQSVIVIGSSDTEGTDSGDEAAVNNRNRYFISERQSSEAGSPLGVEGDVKPILRRPAAKCKWTRFDLPFGVEDHKRYRDDFIRRVVRVMGEHPVTFNQNSIKMENLMQNEWGKTFPDIDLEIGRHTPLFDITKQKIYDWHSDIGSLAYNHVDEEFNTTLKHLTEDERTEYVAAQLKKGNHLPFIYARTEKMLDGT